MTPTGRGRTLAAAMSLLVVVGYVAVTLLFVAPANPVTTAFSGVTRAASPYFAQKWNVFAPNIARSNPELRVQAQWRDDDGDLVKSDWRSITDVEFAAVTGNALPSRVQKLSWNTLAAYLTRFRALTDDQRLVVQDTFIERTGDGYRGTPPHELVDRLAALADNRGDVLNLLRYDYMLKEYVTYFATASFDHRIERVRWEVHRERPNDFAQRYDAEQQHAPSTSRFGWRQADDRMDPAALATFEALIARYGDGS